MSKKGCSQVGVSKTFQHISAFFFSGRFPFGLVFSTWVEITTRGVYFVLRIPVDDVTIVAADADKFLGQIEAVSSSSSSCCCCCCCCWKEKIKRNK